MILPVPIPLKHLAVLLPTLSSLHCPYSNLLPKPTSVLCPELYGGPWPGSLQVLCCQRDQIGGVAQQASQGVILGAQGLVPDLREAEVSAGAKLKRKKATI